MTPIRKRQTSKHPHGGGRNSQKKASSSASQTSASLKTRKGRAAASVTASSTASVRTTVTQPPSVVARQQVTPESSMFSAITGHRIASVVGGVANGTPNEEEMSVVSMRGADDSWYLSATKGEAEDGKKYALNKYVRQTLFPRWNFFTRSEQLVWTNNTTSIPQFTCEKMNVKPLLQERWWSENQSEVMKQLNQKRSDVGGAMKKVFMGKLSVGG